MGRRNRQNHELNHNLPQLQNLIKRDPESYSDEFNLQYRHFESLLSLVYLNPSEEHTEFCELVNFLAQTVGCYPDFKDKFANTIIELLREKCLILNMDFRKTLVQCLILLKNKGTIDSLR
jgi:protein SDA1